MNWTFSLEIEVGAKLEAPVSGGPVGDQVASAYKAVNTLLDGFAKGDKVRVNISGNAGDNPSVSINAQKVG